ncbi:hypothetical protein AB9F35_36640, partial [Rhizobium leguminosarum]|uniref:hypothetical protein n=1 Tax=Rhizobium leguminosarum TaxID=384 RepID=UPI003F99E064
GTRIGHAGELRLCLSRAQQGGYYEKKHEKMAWLDSAAAERGQLQSRCRSEQRRQNRSASSFC